jgi:hypothetical protein
MNASITVAAVAVLTLAACSPSPPPPATPGPAASIMPPPTERYTCETSWVNLPVLWRAFARRREAPGHRVCGRSRRAR